MSNCKPKGKKGPFRKESFGVKSFNFVSFLIENEIVKINIKYENLVMEQKVFTF